MLLNNIGLSPYYLLWPTQWQGLGQEGDFASNTRNLVLLSLQQTDATGNKKLATPQEVCGLNKKRQTIPYHRAINNF